MAITIAFITWVAIRFAKWYYKKKYGVISFIIPFCIVYMDKAVSKLFHVPPTVQSVEEFYQKMCYK